MISIRDNFLDDEHYNQLTNLHIEYSKVHWFGRKAEPQNALHELILKTAPLDYVTGATAWYNIRPIDPQWHNDIDSYCTQNGQKFYPMKHPETTMLYYVKSPKSGGELELQTDVLHHHPIIPVVNRLVTIPCNLTHRVRPYTGNRVSIGIIWWFDVPVIYGDLNTNDIEVLDRVWEIEDERT